VRRAGRCPGHGDPGQGKGAVPPRGGGLGLCGGTVTGGAGELLGPGGGGRSWGWGRMQALLGSYASGRDLGVASKDHSLAAVRALAGRERTAPRGPRARGSAVINGKLVERPGETPGPKPPKRF